MECDKIAKDAVRGSTKRELRHKTGASIGEGMRIHSREETDFRPKKGPEETNRNGTGEVLLYKQGEEKRRNGRGNL